MPLNDKKGGCVKKKLTQPLTFPVLTNRYIYEVSAGYFTAENQDNTRWKSLPDGDWNTCKSNSGIMASTWSKTSACTPS